MGANPSKIVVIPNPLSVEGLHSAVANPDAPPLLFVGRLLEHKHADLAVQSTKLLLDRGYDVRLDIVGVGPEEGRLRELVAAENLDQRVTFISSVDTQEELWSLMKGARVLLAPSTREGYGLVVAESLAMGTPVVCVEHPDNESKSLVDRFTGTVVEPFSAEALADGAEFWLSNDSPRDDRSSFFISEHHELTVDAMVSSYVDVLRQVR